MKIKSWREYSKLDILELGLRLWMGVVLIKNSGVGIITPLEERGLKSLRGYGVHDAFSESDRARDRSDDSVELLCAVGTCGAHSCSD